MEMAWYQKYSHDGSTLLLQIGTKFLCDSANGVCAGDSPSQGFSPHAPCIVGGHCVDPIP